MADVKKATQTGMIPFGFHEAARSEYLAQYVFTAFGTSSPVLRTEDHGVDFHCTLTRQEGTGLWPDGYYAVQVKSMSGKAKPKPWTFRTPESVRFFVEYPAPLFLCMVDKKAAQLKVYQSLVRFGVTVSGELPAQLTLIPTGRGPDALGPYGGPDPVTSNYLLGDPVLDFTIPDLLDEEKFIKLKAVLKYWVDIDSKNIDRYRIGLRTLRAPAHYSTNEVPGPDTMMDLRMTRTAPPVRERQEALVREILEGLVGARLEDGDRVGALLAALQVRHYRDTSQAMRWPEVASLRANTRLNAATGADPEASEDVPLDVLLNRLAETVENHTGCGLGR